MIRWRRGTVVSLGREWRGSLELTVDVAGDSVPALAHPELVGRPQPGDAVLLNVAAVELGLGTGGYALVVAFPDRLPADRSGPGHLVKARYTPLQTGVLGADEQEAPSHRLLADEELLAPPGLPVVVADLHSSLPAVVAGVLADRPAACIAYVMT